MKKFLSVCVVAAGLLFAGKAEAQTKIGYIKIDDIVGLLPELAQGKVNMDTVGQKFVNDSIVPNIKYKQDEYTKKLQEYADSTKPKSVRDIILKDIQSLQEELSGADNYVQQVLQFKQREFLAPYYAKVKKAVDEVAKKKGYTHVLSTDVFLIAPPSDDLSLAVLDELKIKLPQAAGGAKPPATKN
jgi:outer membrane protein